MNSTSHARERATRIFSSIPLFSSIPRRFRHGVTMIELIASASIITLMISSTATLCLRIQRIDREAHIDQLALHELANNLEDHLGKQSGSSDSSSAPAEGTFEISPSLRTQWPDAFIESERTTDGFGERLTLRLYRSREPGIQPLELFGWAPPSTGESP